MRLSELTGKEVINLHDGAKIGMVNECELVFDPKSGEVKGMIVPNKGFFNFLNDNHATHIPWEAIKRIGDEVIIVEISRETYE